ncbi:hypothetical protein CS063_08520 [Sporanaerobium hydrogeniformans]|uniref:Uncharacterized protein n=1 Tax=Sporanaerobium hydrogeniformans TaxID=3072179 RepID=A0AC61DDW2_9FIRM|nr:hypothetical protein [Sporanaerobium hydrogeniformans]PHV70802.1 hypothetical protein CS063_08520 [Sporanaerobium hydrogeniformans]
MKNKWLFWFLYALVIFCCVGCGTDKKTDSTPTETTRKFLDALKDQNFSAVKEIYAENIDNLPNFKNKVEDISPLLANKLFDKMFDFEYTIDKVELDEKNPKKATVLVTLNSYDLGKAFQSTITDYLKTDLQMTFNGATDDEIIKKAEEVIVKDIEKAEKNFVSHVGIKLTEEEGNWKLDKIGDNPEFLNALSGNIIATINQLNNNFNTTQ